MMAAILYIYFIIATILIIMELTIANRTIKEVQATLAELEEGAGINENK